MTGTDTTAAAEKVDPPAQKPSHVFAIFIRADREQALFRLGVSEDTATLLATLTPAQMMKIAASNTLLCRFRMDDDLVWGLLTNHGKAAAANDTTSRLHASILMAGRHQEAA